jgi:hypothetical protein
MGAGRVIEEGLEPPASSWLELSQDRIDAFAAATGGRFRVESVEQLAGASQATIAATVEREGGDRPVCVAELLLRLVEEA